MRRRIMIRLLVGTTICLLLLITSGYVVEYRLYQMLPFTKSSKLLMIEAGVGDVLISVEVFRQETDFPSGLDVSLKPIWNHPLDRRSRRRWTFFGFGFEPVHWKNAGSEVRYDLAFPLAILPIPLVLPLGIVWWRSRKAKGPGFEINVRNGRENGKT